MRVRVDEVRSEPGGRVRVAFSCAVGSGIAFWRSVHGSPDPKRQYDIEIDLADPLVLGQNASILPAAFPSLATEGDRAFLSGVIDSVDEDGLVYLRLAPDCLIAVEAEPGEFRPGQFVRVDVPATALELVPFGRP